MNEKEYYMEEALREAKKAFEFGADAVVIGSAVTRPQLIAKRFREVEKGL